MLQSVAVTVVVFWLSLEALAALYAPSVVNSTNLGPDEIVDKVGVSQKQ
jgi:hypothetical protein